ncbi:MAG: SRPBCC family protein [Paracoccaceae bacterium]|nr:SRPBCC family protein [Paracoccaceae bacterium]
MQNEQHQQEHDRLRRMVSLPRPPAEVWAEVGGFGQIADWHPLIASVELTEIEGDAYRHLTTTDGEIFFERLIETGDHHITYEIVDGPLPASDYRATFSCVAEEGGCHIFWSAYFIPDEAAPELSDKIISKFYEIGLDALRERFA